MASMSAKAAAQAAAKGFVKAACVSAPLKPGWHWFTGACGVGAGSLSALTGLGGAVVFIPTCSSLGMTAKNIVGTTVVSVTCATLAGSVAYTQNNVTDIPAAVAIGVVGAATTPLGQMVAKGVSGKGLRKLCGGLLACASSALFIKKKSGPGAVEAKDGDGVAVAELETRQPGDVAGQEYTIEADQPGAKGGILAYLNSINPMAAAAKTGGEESAVASSASESDEKGTGVIVAAQDGASTWPWESDVGVGQSGKFWVNVKEQFQERIDRNGGDVAEAMWAEREHLLLGLAVGMLQGTVGVGGGVLVTMYMSLMGEMEVHRICATALLATLVTNTAVCAHHIKAKNVNGRVACVLGATAMMASYGTAKTISLSVPEAGCRDYGVECRE